jgi:predicted phage terminase large subunit-like protein
MVKHSILAGQETAFKETMCRSLAGRSLMGFVAYTMPGYLMGWAHEIICHELDAFLGAVQRKESPRLMLTMPPRHGKSQLTSRCFPAYAFGRHPDITVISTSYSADLSSRMNRDVQRIIDSDKYQQVFPGVGLSGKNIRSTASGNYLRNSDIFEIVDHRGSYRSAGVGGGITGMGGDIVIIDDPLKDRAEADSATIREKVWDWYTSTLYTRLAPGGGILLIQTRWHMDDLAGRLLEAEKTGGGDTWRVVNFPAIAENDEPHRRAGEALHPERYPLEQLEAIKSTIGARDWAALYQQHPVPDGGAIFRREWIRHYLPKDRPASFDKMLISWDMTFKDSDDSDYVVGQVWGRKGASFYLLDQVRGRLSFTATQQAFVDLAQKWPTALEKLVEDTANGPAIIDSLKKQIRGIIPVKPDGSKTARAHAITPLFEAGNVLIPDPQVYPWALDYETELLQFPSAAHDDQVDATTQALRRFQTRVGLAEAMRNVKIDDWAGARPFNAGYGMAAAMRNVRI